MQASVFIFLQKESVSVFNSFANIFLLYLCSFYVQVNYSGVALWGTSYLALTLAVPLKMLKTMFFAPLSFFIFWNRHCGLKLLVAFFFTQRDRDWERERAVLALPTIFQGG